jgi:adenylate kinase
VPLDLLLLGVQGSGKGTQAKRLASEYGLAHVATGDMLRTAMANGTTFGQRVKPIYDAGDLVPDDLMIELIRERLAQPDTEAGFILDGFPRTMPQADALDSMLAEIERPLSVVLELQVPDEVAIERLHKRADEEGRADDTPKPIAKRIELYHEQTKPLVSHYRLAGTSSASTATAPRTRSSRRSSRRVEQASGGRAMIIRKSTAEIEKMATAGRVVAGTIAMLHDHIRPGVSDGRARRAGPTSTFGRRAASRLSRATAAIRRRSARRRTTWSCMGFRTGRTVSEGDILSVDVGVILDGFVADSAFTFAVERSPPTPSGCSRGVRRRSPRGSPSVARGTSLSDVSHAIQVATEDAGFSVVRSLVGHGIGRADARGPANPELRPSRARPGTPAGDDVRDRADDQRRRPGCVPARRRVVDLDDGRLAFGPLRAHRCDHRRWPENPHRYAKSSGNRFATIVRLRAVWLRVFFVS